MAKRAWMSVGATVVGVLALMAWQLSLFRTDLQPTHDPKVTGLHSQDRFIYFLYYRNLFPVATLESGLDWYFSYSPDWIPPQPSRLEYSPAGADRQLTEHGASLVQEWGATIRSENHLQTYLFLPDAWRRGSPQLAETRLTNAAVFMLALAGLFVAFAASQRWALGAFLVVLIGSNPFQIFAAYREENIKSWPITMFCVAAGLMAPLIAGRSLRGGTRATIVVAIGLLFATSAQIRTETITTLLGVIVVLLTLWEMPWRARVGLAALTLVSFGVGLLSWTAFFDHKIEEARQVVRQAGGHVYEGPLEGHHILWASLWPGLGDFDRTHGYALGDAAPIAYLEPLLKSRFNEDIAWWWGVSRKSSPRRPSDFYDADHLYYKYPFDAPNTAVLLREKVLSDIAHDPLWYLGILSKRAWRILGETTPVQVFLTPRAVIRIPFHGLMAVMVLLAACWKREWVALRLLILSLPLSLIPLGITSAAGFTYFSIYHLIAAAVLLAWVASWARTRARRSPAPRMAGVGALDA